MAQLRLQGPLLTADKAAEYLAVSRRTVETWTAEGRLRSFRIGRVRRYTLTALDACITENSRADVRRRRAPRGVRRRISVLRE